MDKKFQEVEERRHIRLANTLGGELSSRGLMLSTVMRNRFNSHDVGVVLSLGDNPDENLYVGQIR